VRSLGCSARTLQDLQSGKIATGCTSDEDGTEPSGYLDAIDDPASHVQFLQIDTNEPETVGYWRFLAAAQGVKTNVRYVP
jgi:hypothetical protein